VRTGVWNISTDIYRFQDLSHIQFTEKPDGSGTLLITPVGTPQPQSAEKGRLVFPIGTIRIEFIDDVKAIFLILQEKIDTNALKKA